MPFAVNRRFIWNDILLARPLDDIFVVVTVIHELAFPKRSVYNIGRIPFVFSVMSWFVFPFVRRHK